MFLAYDGIVFDVLLLNGWDINAIMSDDGVDFLYWHHLIDVTCIVNPAVVAADIFPPRKFTGINNVIKTRKRQDDARIKSLQDKIKTPVLLKGLNFPIGERPNKSPIIISSPPTQIPSTEVPTASGKDLFHDKVGTTSEKATDKSPSLPTISNITPGIPYDPDLAAKTGPISEPITEWSDPTTPIASAPAKLSEAVTPEASTPTSQLGKAESGLATLAKDIALAGAAAVVNPLQTGANIIGNVIGDAQAGNKPPANDPITTALEDLIIGAPRPPKPEPMGTSSATELAKEPPKGDRKRWPTNNNFPASDIELRDRLQAPRRQLIVWINSGVNGTPECIINLPYEGCDVDAKHGPLCKNVGTVSIHGNVTGVKRLVFECFEALPIFFGSGKETTSRRLKTFKQNLEAKGANLLAQNVRRPDPRSTPPIISNRWDMKQVPNPQTYLNTTVISGKAVFRMDVLSRMHITPDQLRAYIMPPIPTGYVRQPPEVSLGSANNEVIYRIVDEQQMMNNPSGYLWGVHSVAVTDSVTANNPIDFFGPVFRPEGARR